MTPPYYQDESVTLHHGDALAILRDMPSGTVDCCVTSPPYFGLRDYGVAGQIGAEKTPAEYVGRLRELFAEVRRVLADDGTLWLNLGDSYYSGRGNPGPNSADNKQPARRGFTRAVDKPGADWSSPKNLLGIPWRVAFALQDDGWILRNSIIWHKLTAMPEPVQDRLSNRHENLFLFSKRRRYWFDLAPIREPLIHPDAADGTRVFGGANKAATLTTGSSSRRTGRTYQPRPQRARAEELARQNGLTEEHFAAIRACGITDTGKATIQTGTGKNRPEVQALADEAKAALGGYYREFLTTVGKNPGDVWSIAAEPFAEAHFATFPSELPRRCIVAGCKPGGTVLDPFSGSGTTGMVAQKNGRKYIGIDLNAEYLDLSLRTRLANATLNFDGAA